VTNQCPERASLQRTAREVLQNLIDLTHQQLEAISANDQNRLLLLDKRLEHVFGEKERAFGALSQHTKEHGC
jgi:hypothetical protein